MSQDQQQKIADAINKAGVNPLCAKCGKSEMLVADRYVQLLMTDEAQGGITLSTAGEGASLLPSALLTCPTCGFIELHFLRTLGLA